MKKINNRWYDENNNSWNAELETEETACLKSKSLVGCSGCSDCSGCSGCSYCSDYKENPQRITSGKLGSRNANTTVYWNGDNVQVVCGCFRGNLDEFGKAVINRHKGNEYFEPYMKFINKVKAYMEI